MNLKDQFETNLRKLGKDTASELLIFNDIAFLLREDVTVDVEAIQQLAQLDDPLIRALCSFLTWKLDTHRNFPEITSFFLSLKEALTKYEQHEILCMRLLEIHVDKRMQFNMQEQLEKDLLDFAPFLDKTLAFNLVISQELILKAYLRSLSALERKNLIDKSLPFASRVYEICLKLEERYKKAEKYDLERAFIQLRIEANHFLKKDKVDLMRLRIAESYEDEGDLYEKRNLGLGLGSYARAFMSYLDLGKKEKLEVVKGKLKESAKVTTSSMKPIQLGSFKIHLGKTILGMIPEIKYYNVLESLANLSSLYPKCYFPKDEEMGVGIRLIPFYVIDSYYNVSAILDWDEDPEECRKYRAFQLFRIEDEKISLIRLELFKFLISAELLSKADIDQLFDSSPIEDNLRQRLKLGVNLHFENDFISASYILTLQIEPTLISLIRKRSSLIAISPKRNRRGATQETTLGLLLENHEVKALFDQDFYNLLELYFTYDLGFNYRNEIAHGLISHNKLSEKYSLTVILFLCRLLFMLKE